MKLVKYRVRGSEEFVGLLEPSGVLPIPQAAQQFRSLTELLESSDPKSDLEFIVDRAAPLFPLESVTLLPPIDQQEVWAAGVTYRRSRTARMEESEAAASCYDRVYTAPRTELFMKATAHRVIGPGQPVRIRKDSAWNVPEPELTLVLNSRMRLVGFTIGNDMSSRDIEGENPLYLPQAKVYDGSCAIGPCITLLDYMPTPEDAQIRMQIYRSSEVVFDGNTSTSNLARSYSELIGWLGRDNSFPHGAMLMTGAGIVPENDFTLEPGDVVEITIDGIGTLRNSVVRS